MPATIELVEAGYRFADGTAVLDGVSLDVTMGETVALLGRSGAGKTTALKLVNALLLPTSGDVRVEGQRTRDWDPIRLRRRIGWVIQEGGLFPHRTVAENVALVPTLEGWSAERTTARVREMLTMVDLPVDEFGTRRPHMLSGGQRQRVGVARALAADPPIVLFDEPFGALDPITRRELRGACRRWLRALGKTAVFVTHDVREAREIADRIALLEGGRLVALDAPAALERSTDPRVQTFLEAAG